MLQRWPELRRDNFRGSEGKRPRHRPSVAALLGRPARHPISPARALYGRMGFVVVRELPPLFGLRYRQQSASFGSHDPNLFGQGDRQGKPVVALQPHFIN